VQQAIEYLAGIFSSSLFELPAFSAMPGGKRNLIITVLLILVFVCIEWIGREQKYAIEKMGFEAKRPVRWLLYYSIIFAVLYFAGSPQQFIYFQF
jgi:ABC-type Fe3+ transport system permease subunit